MESRESQASTTPTAVSNLPMFVAIQDRVAPSGERQACVNVEFIPRTLVGFPGCTVKREIPSPFVFAVLALSIILMSSVAFIRQSPAATSDSSDLIPDLEDGGEMRALDLTADHQIGAQSAWAQGHTGAGVRLAILDSGINTGHLEFTGRIAECHTEIVGTTCIDGTGHGTHVAGLAGAEGKAPGAKGVAPGVSLLTDKISDPDPTDIWEFEDRMKAGIEWAVANQARVISISVGWGPLYVTSPNCDSSFPELAASINSAVAAGVIVVAAAGNFGEIGNPPREDPNRTVSPGCISDVIAVGAVDSADQRASFSSFGTFMTDHGLVAPGVHLLSPWIEGGNYGDCDEGAGSYAWCTGTSMATPLVAGTIALMLSKNPSLSVSTIKSILFSTTVCTQSPCPNVYVGKGRIDAGAAVNATGYSLTISADESRGTTNPTPGMYLYPAGTEVTVVANPNNECYWFSSWSLDGETYFDNPITVYMDRNHSLVAAFGRIPRCEA